MDSSTLNILLVPGILSLGGAVIAIVGAIRNTPSPGNQTSRFVTGIPGLLILVVAGWSLIYWPTAYLAKLTADPLAKYTAIVALIGAILSFLVAFHQPRSSIAGEFFAMVLFTTVGLVMVGMARDLLVLFLAIELSSVPSYVLVGLSRRHALTEEAGAKYFFLGALATSLLAFGFVFLYGATGSMDLSAVMQIPQTGQARWLATVGLIVSFAAIAFKITAVPFYFYAPDVYQGTAGGATAIIAFLPKVAGFIALLRLLAFVGFTGSIFQVFWPILWIVAALTVTIGNILALLQTDVKRILAYSSISHSGYMLIALAAVVVYPDGLQNGLAAVLFYVLIYGLMSLGAFGALGYLASVCKNGISADEPSELRDLAGLSRTQPVLSLLLAVFLLSLTGMPPTGGFWGKVYIFTSTLAAGNFWLNLLAVIGLVNAGIGAAYYFRILTWIYIRPAGLNFSLPIFAKKSSAQVIAFIGLFLTAAILIVLGLAPTELMQICETAAKVLIR